MLFVKRLLILFVCLALFVATPLLNLIGYSHTMESGPSYFKIHPATYTILFCFCWYVYMMRYHLNYILKHRTRYMYVLGIIAVIVFTLSYSGRGQSLSFIADTLLAAVLFMVVYPGKDSDLNRKIQKIVLVFYVINCLMAIYEKAFDINLFPARGLQFFGFRASALQGHPLNNALITVTIMSYIYIYDMKNKYLLLVLGLTSLVCFGTRGALYGIVGCTVLFAVGKFLLNYRVSSKRLRSKVTKLFTGIFIFSSILALIYLVTATKFGGRLAEVSFFDEGSAGARLDVLNIFRFFNSSDILWGADPRRIKMATSDTGVSIIENFWIVWMLRFGLIMMLLLVIPLIRMMYKQLRPFKNVERLYILGVFFVVASTNNSLATNTMALSIFLICSFAFQPGQTKIKNVKQTAL